MTTADPNLQALLRELAAQNPDLCVITTRQHVTDLDRVELSGLTNDALIWSRNDRE